MSLKRYCSQILHNLSSFFAWYYNIYGFESFQIFGELVTWEDWPYLAIISRSSGKLRTADGTIVLKNWIYTTEELPPPAITLSLSGIIQQRKWNHQHTGCSQYESTSIFVLRSCLLTNVVVAITGFCYLQQNIMTQLMISPKPGKIAHLNSPLWLVPSISIFIFN